MTDDVVPPETADGREGHGGEHAVDVARAHRSKTMFTLSGAHVFPMYDAAVQADPAMRLVDVRHEPSAVFAAEATGKLTRHPGLAVLTAGPGVTNGVSAVAQAYFAGSPLVVVGGRAPTGRWGTGSLQELDHPPLFSTIAKSATTAQTVDYIAPAVDNAFTLAGSSHRGPTFVDVPMDQLFSRTTVETPPVPAYSRIDPDTSDLRAIGAALAEAKRPVVVIGTDVWADRSERAALHMADELGVPVVANGMGRGVVPAQHRLQVTKARSVALGQCDLAIVVGAPLDFRLGYGSFGGKEDTPAAKVIHIVDSPGQLAAHVELDASAAGDLTACLHGVIDATIRAARTRPDWSAWVDKLSAAAEAAVERDAKDLAAESNPIHPARIYGELIPRLADDAVVIGDGGDFVSFAGKYIEPARPGCWLDPGPYGCLGAGLGAAMAARIARPSSQVVLLLGDGAAGMSLIDIDTLVRHDLPVVMVVGNNAGWGLEKHPMRFLYGYDVAADLAPDTRYDQIATALGAGGEAVSEPGEIGPALDRAFASGKPYLVNVMTDRQIAYPRSTTGV